MKRLNLAIAGLLFSAISALAQSGVKQSGNITPGQVPWWITSGVIGGGVTAADSPISSFGTTGPICSNSARQSSGAWNSLCIQANTNSAATISLQNYGTAPAQSFSFTVNGTPYPVIGLGNNTFIGSQTFNAAVGITTPTFNPGGDVVLRTTAADSHDLQTQLFSFGNSGAHNATAHIAFLTARGTSAAPTPVGTQVGGNVRDSPTGDYYGFMGGWGWTGTSYGLSSALALRPTELQSPTAHGGSVSVATTPNGTTATSYTAIFDQDGNTKLGTTAVTAQSHPANTFLQLSGTDGVNNLALIDNYGTAKESAIIARSARGTVAAPTQTKSGDFINFLGWTGYTNAGAFALPLASGAYIGAQASEDQTATAQGMEEVFFITLNGTNALVEVGRFSATDKSLALKSMLVLAPRTFANLAACSSTIEGASAAITDSSTNTWGATITGNSTNHVMGYCDGTNWTVMGK